MYACMHACMHACMWDLIRVLHRFSILLTLQSVSVCSGLGHLQFSCRTGEAVALGLSCVFKVNAGSILFVRAASLGLGCRVDVQICIQSASAICCRSSRHSRWVSNPLDFEQNEHSKTQSAWTPKAGNSIRAFRVSSSSSLGILKRSGDLA